MSTIFRSGARIALRTSQSSLAPARTAIGRRYLTTDPPHLKSRSWKNSALRWGIAIAGLYYYNTSPVFAESPQHNLLNPNVDAMVDDREDSILNELTASSRSKSKKDASVLQSVIEQSSEDVAEQKLGKPQSGLSSHTTSEPAPASGLEGAADLQEEAEGEAAFNPVTGEINWDCPCLGGMAYGPCGPEFREAFSCFVYSTQEPKGMDCIDKFQNMQNCFRAHPEHYKGELEDDETLDAELAAEKEELQKEIAERREAVSQTQQAQSPDEKSTKDDVAATNAKAEKPSKEKKPKKSSKSATTSKTISGAESQPQSEAKTTSHTPDGYSANAETQDGTSSRITTDRKSSRSGGDDFSESDELVPKADHDATDMSSGASHSRAT